MTNVRVRVAPSPTGFAHIGTLWMTLFNYAFAKKNKGEFILRLDDTDTQREVKGAEQAIYDNLRWAGFEWDEGPDKGGPHGPYRQSEKLTNYKHHAEKLVKEGKAFREEGAIRVKGQRKPVTWTDLKRGKVSFPESELEKDFVIIKSNGYPTYHFATVVDEIDMNISHVIRGDEHISNTPRQILFYELLGHKPPLFAHIPTIRNVTGKKLSKRTDPVDISIYRRLGYLPEALINYLCLLGWSHPEEKDIFDLSEFINNFSLERVQKSEPKFDSDKLDWVNSMYIRNLSPRKLSEHLSGIHEKFKDLESSKKDAISSIIQSRIKKLSDFEDYCDYFFNEPDLEITLFDKKDTQNHLFEAHKVLNKLNKWNLEEINNNLNSVISTNGLKVGDFYMALRLAITGKRNTPPINESMEILGKETVINRIEKALNLYA